MNAVQQFKLSGIALPKNAVSMLDEICEHFVEHSDVQRNDNQALLKNDDAAATISVQDDKLLIELDCVSEKSLQLTRVMLAEHLFYFAGDDPFELTWSEPPSLAALPNIHHVTVVGAEDVTPHMRRVKFACEDITPFIGGGIHVRLLVPPKDRVPVWPGYRADGRIAWPEGEDEILVRVYTIRAVDIERKELWIDFLQHPAPGIATPGADFARDAEPGQKAALIGPGGGGLPAAKNILMVGDESALPAIARIAADASADTAIRAIIEVESQAEEQVLPSAASLDVRWLHRASYAADAQGVLAKTAQEAIASTEAETYIWVACEREDIRLIRPHVKSLQRDKKSTYVAWYWEREHA